MSDKFKNGRTRSSNFTKEDQLLLLKAIKDYKAVLQPKKTDSVKQADKQQAWVKITDYFNSNTLCQTRNTENLIHCYRNMKRRMKKQHSEVKMLLVGVSPESVSNDSDNFLSSYHDPMLGKEPHSDLHEVKIEPNTEDKLLLSYISDAGLDDHSQPIEEKTIDNSQKHPLEENMELRTDVLHKSKGPVLSHNGRKGKTSFINSFKELSKAKLELVTLQKVVLENEYKHKKKLQEIHLQDIIEENKFKHVMRKKELELIQIKINNAKNNVEP